MLTRKEGAGPQVRRMVSALTWAVTWGTQRRSLTKLSLRPRALDGIPTAAEGKETGKCWGVQVHVALSPRTVFLQPAKRLEILHPSGFAIFLD